MPAASPRKVSMTDVARMAGVSQATVSRVVNGQVGVSADVAEQVTQAIDELGYEAPARRRENRTDHPTLALLVLDNHYLQHVDVFNSILRGISMATNKTDATLLFLQTHDPAVIRRQLADQHVAGLLLAGTTLPDEVGRIVNRIPSVWLSSYHDEAGDHVVAGNEVIGKTAATYLAKTRGHAQLAYLTAGNDYPAFRIRQQAFEFYGYSQQVPVHIIQGDPSLRKHAGTHSMDALEEHASRLAETLLALDPLPTGLFVPFDLLTALVYRQLQKRGVKIGQDLEILSCNHQPTCLAGLMPRPATIDIGAETIGAHAVEQVLWRIRYPEARQNLQLLVEPVLIEGEHLRDDWQGGH